MERSSRHRQAVSTCGLHRAERHLVIARKHASRWLLEREQLLHRVRAGLHAERALHHQLFVERDAGGTERIFVSGQAMLELPAAREPAMCAIRR